MNTPTPDNTVQNPEPLHGPPLLCQIAAIEELVNSSYWPILPHQVQDNWQRQLDDLRGRQVAGR